MYGTIALKYAAGSTSFVEGLSQTLYNDHEELAWRMADIIDPYYLGLIVFGFIAIFFSLGNIENSKYL